jgi:hypothetical protein
MADRDSSSHQANITDIEAARKGDATSEKIFRNGDDSEIQDANFSQAIGADDEAAIPKGTIDPVYEAKARVLNHAVCANMLIKDLMLKYASLDSRDRYGMVSMAALHRRWVWLGK